MAPISRCVTDEPRPRFLPVLQGSLIVPVSQGSTRRTVSEHRLEQAKRSERRKQVSCLPLTSR